MARDAEDKQIVIDFTEDRPHVNIRSVAAWQLMAAAKLLDIIAAQQFMVEQQMQMQEQAAIRDIASTLQRERN